MKVFFSVLLLLTAELFAEECFETGKIFKAPFYNSYSTFNKDRTKFFTFDENNGEKISTYDAITGETQEFAKEIFEWPLWTGDGKLNLYKSESMPGENFNNFVNQTPEKYLEYLKRVQVRTLDPRTNKFVKTIGKIQDPKTGEFYTPVKIETIANEKVMVLKDKNGRMFRENILPRKDSIYHNDETKIDVTWSKDGSLKVFGARNELLLTTKLMPDDKTKNDLANRKMEEQFGRSSYFEEKKVAVIRLNNVATDADQNPKPDNGYLVIDLKSNSPQIIRTGEDEFFDFSKNKISKDGKKILINNRSGAITYLDLNNNKLAEVAAIYMEVSAFDEDDNICGIIRSETPIAVTYECYNPVTKKKISSKLINRSIDSRINVLNANEFLINEGIPKQGNDLTYPEYDAILEKIKHTDHHRLETTCSKKITFKDCNCDPSLTPKVNVSDFAKIELKLACEDNFSESHWKSLTPLPIESLDEKTSFLWMKRFSKIGGFSVKKHLPVIQTIISEKIYLKYPSEFQSAMEGVLHETPVFYNDILHKYPELITLKSEKGKTDTCQTPSEIGKIALKKREFFKKKVANLSNPTDENLGTLFAFAKEILSEKEKETFAEDVADLIVEKMVSSSMKGMFPSKVYKFALNSSKAKLGLPYKDITDITAVRDGATLTFSLLSVKPIDQSTPTMGGIHLVKKESFQEKDIPFGVTNHKFHWINGDKKFSATVEIDKEVQKSEIAPSNPAPHYKAMKKNKTYRGLIVAGTNLGKSTTDNVVQEYLEYYSEQGFKFSAAVEIQDLHQLLKERISGNDPAHYFVKEAHSDGDEKNLFRINKTGKVLRGIKMNKGVKEIIEIVYPGKNEESLLVTNTEFGTWMKERDEKGGPEMVYLNSSCWSTSKATYEISTAKTSKLINIPTITSMQTFVNSEDNVMFAAIDGLLKEKTYKEIRESMKKNPKYKDGSDNVMIFPDEEKYQTNIRDLIKIPITIDTKTYIEKDNKLIPYSIEE